MSTIWAFNCIENKHALYRGQDCMKKICESLRQHGKNIINFEKKKILPLTKEELKSHQDARVSYICGKRILKKFYNGENFGKVRDHCNFTDKYRGEAHGICNLKFNMPDEIPVVFHKGSNYDYHFIIKKISKRVWQTICMSWGKYRKVNNFFLLPLKKKLQILIKIAMKVLSLYLTK